MSEEAINPRIANRGDAKGKGEKDKNKPRKKSNTVAICKSNPKTEKYGAILDLGGNCHCFRGETNTYPMDGSCGGEEGMCAWVCVG